MSRYEWEKGEFTIPSADWAKFKTSIRFAVNAHTAKMHEVAQDLHRRIETLKSANPKLDIRAAIEDEAWKAAEDHHKRTSVSPIYGYGYSEHPYSWFDVETIKASVSARSKTPGSTRVRLRKPLKKDFPVLGNNATSFDAGGCSLVFHNDTRTARWKVDDNNHAVEEARKTELAKALFSALEKVKWTRGSGGRIWGGDEYNSDAASEHGYQAGYDKETFGDRGTRFQEELASEMLRGYGR